MNISHKITQHVKSSLNTKVDIVQYDAEWKRRHVYVSQPIAANQRHKLEKWAKWVAVKLGPAFVPVGAGLLVGRNSSERNGWGYKFQAHFRYIPGKNS